MNPLLSVIILAAVDSVHSSSTNQELFFGLMIGTHENSGAKLGVEDALNSINQRSDLLSGYKLNYTDLQVLLQLIKICIICCFFFQ